MKLTAQILLNPTKEQADLLFSTMKTANAACGFVSDMAWESRHFNKFGLRKLAYYTVRERFGLSAQLAIQQIFKVANAYKLDKETKRTFRPLGSIAYDSRILSYKTKNKTVSIWTMEGRQTIPYLVGQHHAAILAYQQGESDLVYKKGRFYLLATCEVPEEDSEPFVDVLGVDLGIVNIATDSDGDTFSGSRVEQVRQWYSGRKQVLQSVGTKSAKRRLKQLSGREAKFRSDTNHRISKKLVSKAKDTNRAIVLEDLSGIRKRTTVKKAQRAKHHSWSFHQLRSFVHYKAQRNGVQVMLVNPAYTSRTCSVCSHCEKANRKSQSEFLCKSCGHNVNADLNAAFNIRRLGLSSYQPMVSTGIFGQGQAPRL